MNLREQLLAELARDPRTAAMADPRGHSNFAQRSQGVTSDREMLAFTRDEIAFNRAIVRHDPPGSWRRREEEVPGLALALSHVLAISEEAGLDVW